MVPAPEAQSEEGGDFAARLLNRTRSLKRRLFLGVDSVEGGSEECFSVSIHAWA